MLDMLFLIAAIIGGTVMICQFLLTLVGMGHDGGDIGDGDFSGDADAAGDFDIDGDLPGDNHTPLGYAADADYQHPDSSWLFGVLSFRTLIAAAAFFGVAGKTALSAGMSQPMALVIAILLGLAAMYGMYYLMQAMSKLTSSGNERISISIGKHATVYVPIPADGAGLGKVQVTLQNRTVEYQAVSEETEPLRTGETVEIIEVKNSDTVAVRRLAAPVEA